MKTSLKTEYKGRKIEVRDVSAVGVFVDELLVDFHIGSTYDKELLKRLAIKASEQIDRAEHRLNRKDAK